MNTLIDTKKLSGTDRKKIEANRRYTKYQSGPQDLCGYKSNNVALSFGIINTPTVDTVRDDGMTVGCITHGGYTIDPKYDFRYEMACAENTKFKNGCSEILKSKLPILLSMSEEEDEERRKIHWKLESVQQELKYFLEKIGYRLSINDGKTTIN